MLSKLASIFGLVILMATVPVNSGSFWPNNGPCTPNLTAPGICNDNDGTLVWFDVNGKKTAFSASGQAATVTVGTTTTLAAGSSATVANSGTPSAAVLNFGIPAGVNGINGTNATLVGQVCRFSISSLTQDGKGNAAGVLTIVGCP